MSATPKQLKLAIERLSQADHLRLHEAARILMVGTSWLDSSELVADAVEAAYLAAACKSSEGWASYQPVSNYLIMIMRRLAADDSGERIERTDFIPAGEMAPTDAGQASRLMERIQSLAFEDLDNCSDKELEAEACKDGEDISALAAQMRLRTASPRAALPSEEPPADAADDRDG
jgi:DNA-directed RNA polymerase specialized sigma24 family protein